MAGEGSESGRDQVQQGDRRRWPWSRIMMWSKRRQVHHCRHRKGRRRQEGVPMMMMISTPDGVGGDGENSHEDLNRRARRSQGPQASSRRSLQTTSTHSPCFRWCCKRPRSVSWLAAWVQQWLSGRHCPSTSSLGALRRSRCRWEESSWHGRQMVAGLQLEG